ncbi:MAG: ABC transporter ATP-binding protein [Sciscionella sp.]|nr:ABC transporter ATP-binding protein [Sciscionella sp.]
MLELQGIAKRYGRGDWVLRDVDLTLSAGVATTIAGHNGAGKSTLLRIIAGVARPSRGRIVGRPRIGYLPDRFPAAGRMTATEYLRHMAAIRGVSTAGVGQLLDRLWVLGAPAARMGELSKGNTQKVGLAQAFLAKPELLVLDEPCSGLDASSRSTVAELITEARSNGAAVVCTDHVIDRFDGGSLGYQLIDGKLSRQESTVDISPVVLIRLAPASSAGVVDVSAASAFTDLPGVRVDRGAADDVRLLVPMEGRDALLRNALRAGWSVLEVREVGG